MIARGLGIIILVFTLTCAESLAQGASFHTSLSQNAWIKDANRALMNGDAAKATILYRHALQMQLSERQSYAVLTNYCAALNEMAAHGEALKMCKAAIDIQSRRWQAHNNLGMAFHGLGLYDEAIRCFNKALRYDRDNRTIRRNRDISREALEQLPAYQRPKV